MVNAIALIIVAALAVLGAYYIAEVLAATALPKLVKVVVVVPYIKNRAEMMAVLVAIITGYPGCEILVCTQHPDAKRTVPFQGGAQVQVVTKTELDAFFAERLAANELQTEEQA